MGFQKLETTCINQAIAGDGLMLHAEQFRLRTNSDKKGDCHDYIGILSCNILFVLNQRQFLRDCDRPDRVWSGGQHPSLDQ